MEQTTALGQWLKEKCQEEHLPLRQAAAKTGLCHTTIDGIMKGSAPSLRTVKKLAWGFSDGDNERLALEDRLLELAGYRTKRQGQEATQLIAQLTDKVREFSDPQLKMMLKFAAYLTEITP